MNKKDYRKYQKLLMERTNIRNKIIDAKLHNFKQFNIRNLKIFVNTCNFLLPYMVSAGIVLGSFRTFGGGLPFKIDETTKYKYYHLDYKSNGYVEFDDDYITRHWYEDPLPSSKIVIYTPWEQLDGSYVRYKRSYKFTNIDTAYIFNAVLSEDYSYFNLNFPNYDEVKMTSNMIDEANNDYFFDVSIYALNNDLVIRFHESNQKNLIITVLEILLTLGIGTFVNTKFRDVYYLDANHEFNAEYLESLVDIEELKKKLLDNKSKILSLKKGGCN